MKKYIVSVSATTLVYVEAANEEEAVNKVHNDFELGKNALFNEIETEGYTTEFEEEAE